MFWGRRTEFGSIKTESNRVRIVHRLVLLVDPSDTAVVAAIWSVILLRVLPRVFRLA